MIIAFKRSVKIKEPQTSLYFTNVYRIHCLAVSVFIPMSHLMSSLLICITDITLRYHGTEYGVILIRGMYERKPLLVFVRRLRLGLLNEQMKASELGSSGDDTFNDVVRDFSQLAYSHPERLVRTRSDRQSYEPGGE